MKSHGHSHGGSVEDFAGFLHNAHTVVQDAVTAELQKQANGLAKAIKQAAPSDKGKLRESVRVEPGKRADSITVKAGGPLTTRPVRNGAKETYDYANATEFGTVKETAQPFFYPTYRARKREIRNALQAAVSRAVSGIP
jgi:HK97 gp10 family phage protein